MLQLCIVEKQVCVETILVFHQNYFVNSMSVLSLELNGCCTASDVNKKQQ